MSKRSRNPRPTNRPTPAPRRPSGAARRARRRRPRAGAARRTPTRARPGPALAARAVSRRDHRARSSRRSCSSAARSSSSGRARRPTPARPILQPTAAPAPPPDATPRLGQVTRDLGPRPRGDRRARHLRVLPADVGSPLQRRAVRPDRHPLLRRGRPHGAPGLDPQPGARPDGRPLPLPGGLRRDRPGGAADAPAAAPGEPALRVPRHRRRCRSPASTTCRRPTPRSSGAGSSSWTPWTSPPSPRSRQQSADRGPEPQCQNAVPGASPSAAPLRHARAVAAERSARAPRRPPRRPRPARRRHPRRRPGADLELLAERAGLREELAFLDPRGLLAEDEDLAETRAALERALASGVAGVAGGVAAAGAAAGARARSSASARTTRATSWSRASRCRPGPCSSRSSPTRSSATATR